MPGVARASWPGNMANKNTFLSNHAILFYGSKADHLYCLFKSSQLLTGKENHIQYVKL